MILETNLTDSVKACRADTFVNSLVNIISKKNYKFLYVSTSVSLYNVIFLFSNKMSTPKRSKKQASDEDSEIDVANEAKTYIEKFLGDVSKTTATKQIIIGATTGWYCLFYIVIIILFYVK